MNAGLHSSLRIEENLLKNNIEMSYPILFSENKTHQLQTSVHAATNLIE